MNLSTIRAFYIRYNAKKSARRIRREMKRNVKSKEQHIDTLSKEDQLFIKEKWKKYGIKADLNAFRWLYSVSEVHDWRFITEDVYAEYLMPNMYDARKAIAMDDKNYYDLYFYDILMPETLVRNINGVYMTKNYEIISKEEAEKIVKLSNENVVIKPSVGSCKGNGVKLVDPMSVSDCFAEYKKNFIVQRRVQLHDSVRALNESSANVIRITTALVNDNVYALSPTIRVGDAGRFIDQGGEREFCIGIKDDGTLKDFGIVTKSGIAREDTMPNGFKFGGMAIPNFAQMLEIVKKLHARMAYFPIIGWDMLVDKNGDAVLLECNLNWTGILKYQECNGPLFGELTEEVLNAYCQKG